jgi:hypothetical protein
MYFYGPKNGMASKRTEMGKKLLSKGKSSNIEWSDRTAQGDEGHKEGCLSKSRFSASPQRACRC